VDATAHLSLQYVNWRRRAAFSASSRLFDLNSDENRARKKRNSRLNKTDEDFGTHR
jgi:hypothetical protein